MNRVIWPDFQFARPARIDHLAGWRFLLDRDYRDRRLREWQGKSVFEVGGYLLLGMLSIAFTVLVAGLLIVGVWHLLSG